MTTEELADAIAHDLVEAPEEGGFFALAFGKVAIAREAARRCLDLGGTREDAIAAASEAIADFDRK